MLPISQCSPHLLLKTRHYVNFLNNVCVKQSGTLFSQIQVHSKEVQGLEPGPLAHRTDVLLSLPLQLSKGCSLHLAQRWSQLLNMQLRRMAILSKESAPGLILATGEPGAPRSISNSTMDKNSVPPTIRWRSITETQPVVSWPILCLTRQLT